MRNFRQSFVYERDFPTFIPPIILAVPSLIIARPHPPSNRQPLRPVPFDKLRDHVGLVFT